MYNDYPAAAKANAKKAIDWKEKYGRGEVKGGTAVGWARAHQLASGENLSADTVGRMSSFNRHRKNSKISPEFKDEPWKDNGYIAWLIWGGDEGVDWAMDKMKQIKNEGKSVMKRIKLFEEFVAEKIKAAEAHDTMNGVQTIIDGKREVAFISTMNNPLYAPNNKYEIEAMDYGVSKGLKSIEVKNKKDGKAWVLYKTDKKLAQKLADYASEHEGYLSDSTPEEARYVGNLLGYDKNDIEDFVKRVYKK